MPGVVSFLFRLIHDFPNMDRSIDWTSLVEEEAFSLPFEGVMDTRTVPATLVLLSSKLPDLLPLSLKPDLSERKVRKHNSAYEFMRSEKHPCLCYCKSLVSTTCKLALGETLATQKDPNLGLPTDDKFFEILLDLASTRLNP